MSGIPRRPRPLGPCRTLPSGGRASPTPPSAAGGRRGGRAAAAGLGCEVRPPPPAAPAPRPPPGAPTLVCSRPLPSGSCRADRVVCSRPLPGGSGRADRGCSEEAARRGRLGKARSPGAEWGVGSRLPRPGRQDAGSPGPSRSPTAHGGRSGTGIGCRGGKGPLQRQT